MAFFFFSNICQTSLPENFPPLALFHESTFQSTMRFLWILLPLSWGKDLDCPREVEALLRLALLRDPHLEMKEPFGKENP